MHKPIPPQPHAMLNRSGSNSRPVRGLSSLALCTTALAALLAAAHLLSAQTSAAAPAPAPAHTPVQRHKSSSAVHAEAKSGAKAITPSEISAPAAPAEPKLPAWPANQKPTAATVTWDSQGLHIEATNSSLRQILDDVSAATGAEFEGLGSDQRIFGSYGPGQARDVLSQLLQGSGYNILMIGNQGQGTPRQILLTARSASDSSNSASKSASTNSDEEDTEVEEPQQPAAPSMIRPGFNPPANQRSPQQIVDQMQQERQRMEQQQPQQQPQPQGSNPQN